MRVHRSTIVVAGGVAALLLAGLVGTVASTSASTTPLAPAPLAPAPQTPVDDATLKLGESYQDGDPSCSTKITVDKVQAVTPVMDDYGQGTQPDPDDAYLGVHLTVLNAGTDCTLTDSSTGFTPYDRTGKNIDCLKDYGVKGIHQGKLFPDDYRLHPGQSATGWLVLNCSTTDVAETSVSVGQSGAVWSVP